MPDAYRSRTLAGVVSSIIFRSEDGGDFVIASLRSRTVVKGEAAADEFLPGRSVELIGKWKEDSKRGWQFLFDSATYPEPDDADGATAYLELLCPGTGIGTKTIERLVALFGEKVLQIIREEPDRVPTKIVKRDKLELLRVKLIELRDGEECRRSLMTLISGRGFSKDMVSACMGKWGNDAATVVRDDPFILLDSNFDGAGFKRCDALYLDLGHPKDSQRRYQACVLGTLDDSKGDTWMGRADVAEVARKAMGVTDARIDDIVGKLVGAGHLTSRRLADGSGAEYLALPNRAKSESTAAADILRLTARPGLSASTANPLVLQRTGATGDPTQHQFSQILKATSAGIGMLTGGPGTGKSHCTAWLISQAVKHFGIDKVAACSPTGKAALRLTQLCRQRAEVKLVAGTIHRTLKPMPRTGGRFEFYHNRARPFAFKLLLLDEASMADVSLLSLLLLAVPDDCVVVLVGDVHQLPPVQHGHPLRDLIEEGNAVPHGELTEIHRNAGDLVECCRRIRDGESPFWSPQFLRDERGERDWLRNVTCIPIKGTVAATVESTIKRMRGFAVVGADGVERPLDPVRDVQILTAMNDSGDRSRKPLNEQLSPVFNPTRPREGYRWAAGDRVIAGENKEYPAFACKKADDGSWDIQESGVKAAICNGDILYVLSTGGGTAWLTNEGLTDDEGNVRCVATTNKPGKCKEGQVAVESAWVISTHRSQGSEWPFVVIVADPSATQVAGNQWWYTAVSRAKVATIVVGDEAVVRKQCGNYHAAERVTFLAESLQTDR